MRRMRGTAVARLTAGDLLALSSWSPLAAGREQAPAGQPPATDIAPGARAQIAALLAEKESRTPIQQKIDSQLLYEIKMARGQAIAPGGDTLETGIDRAADPSTVVRVPAPVDDGLFDPARTV